MVDGFKKAIIDGDIDKLEKMILSKKFNPKELLTVKISKGAPRIKINALSFACEARNLVSANMFLSYIASNPGSIDIHESNELPFCTACLLGDLNFLESLLKLESNSGPINIHINNELPFALACKHGHLQIILKLLDLESTHGKINIHVGDDAPFQMSLESNHSLISIKLISMQHTHGLIGKDKIREWLQSEVDMDAVEESFKDHDYKGSKACLSPVIDVCGNQEIKNRLAKFIAGKAAKEMMAVSKPR